MPLFWYELSKNNTEKNIAHTLLYFRKSSNLFENNFALSNNGRCLCLPSKIENNFMLFSVTARFDVPEIYTDTLGWIR